MATANQGKLFGQVLREARQGKYSLRQFARLADVSPTYLSQVEQSNVSPPTADRVQRMAELLGENADEWIALAGRVPSDLEEIIKNNPTQLPELLREASDMTSEQLRLLTNHAKRLKRKAR